MYVHMIQVQGLVVDSLLSLLNLVCRGKGDGPQVFLFNIVSKDGSHVSEGSFVSWKFHLYSFQWGHDLLRRIIKEKLSCGHNTVLGTNNGYG